MRTLKYEIGSKYDGCSVKTVLTKELMLSSSLIAKLKQIKNGICLDGESIRTNAQVRCGQILSVVIGASPSCQGELPYPILFEDEDILIIDKPSGAAAHGSRYDDEVESIESRVTAYYGNKLMYHPVSRLDRGTTGIMTIAKNGYMHQRLSDKLHTDGFFREYLAVVHGKLKEKAGTIDLPIGRADGSAIKREVRADGARALTGFEVIGEAGELSLVRCVPETGRTHQIRLHMAAIGHPLCGDWLYGKEEPELIDRPALHSEKLSFVHPLTNERITLSCELPEDMLKLITQ